jgi:hypothetical protein
MRSREENHKSFIDLLVTPNLRTSTLKALQYIQLNGEHYDTLLLNFPEELEPKVVALASKQISPGELFEYLERSEIIPEPVTSWEYTARPILKALPGLKTGFPDLKIQCYGNKETEASSMDISHAYARLTLRTIITSKVDLSSWRETISQSLRLNTEEVDEKSKRIQFKAGVASACLADMGPSHLKKTLSETVARLRVIYVEKPYHFTPLSILERKMTQGPLSDDELEKLVLRHVEYVRKYIYRFRNRDRAHYEWALDKATWPKLGLERNEVRLLDNLINDK